MIRTQLRTFLPSVNRPRRTVSVFLKDLLIRLNSLSPEVPPVTCVISDGVMSFGMRVAQELGIPDVQFWTASACGFLGCLSFRELVKRGIAPFKDESVLRDGTLDASINWIPGMPNIRVKDLPNYIRFRAHDPNDIMFNFMGEEAQACLKDASAIILNTFDEFEHQVIDEIRQRFPREVYTIGFLALLAKCIPENHPCLSLSASLWKEETECLDWLDGRNPGSVVYVNYGSVTVMSDQHFIEFAWGLANSKHPFLWIVRPDILSGGGESTSSILLPPEFHNEIQGRGKLATWCPQEKVVGHPSVGAFLTHCGWNSVTESVGIPLICWPFFADQHTNCRFACNSDSWGVGLEVSHQVKREEIEGVVREAMGSTEMKRRAREWKKKAQEAVCIGGSSFVNFDRLIKEALHFRAHR